MSQVSTAAESAPDSEKLPAQQPPRPAPASSADGGRFGMGWGLFLVGAGIVLLAVAAPWGRAGLWDPIEVRTADLARRAAIHVFGGEALGVAGPADLIPTVEEVGRGEWPVLSISLALRAFGNHAWAFRLPLLLWAGVGLYALYLLCKRLADTETALLSCLVLACSPLYFVQARTGLGDIVTMASVAVAFAGFHLAWADAHLSQRARLASVALGLLACVSGFFCRGAWLGVAVPGLASGLTWALLPASDATRAGRGYGLAALLIGGVGVVLGVVGWLGADAANYSYALGSAVVAIKKLPTHDAVIAQLGHGFFPWSALLPAALGAALVSNKDMPGPRFALGMGLFLAVALAALSHALLFPKVGMVPFAAPFALAGVCALGLRGLDRKVAGSPVVAALTVALLVLLMEDFANSPEKAFVAFGVEGPAFPAALIKHSKRTYQVVTGLGVVFFAALALERIGWYERVFLKLLQRLHLTRARWAGASLVAGGLVLSWGYYPALANQLSPAGVYDTYHRLASEKEPLGVVGQAATQGSAFYAQRPVKALESPRNAVEWLNTATERRWLILKRKDLANTNSLYRAAAHRGNLVVVDAASSEILLASNQLSAGQENANPLNSLVFDVEPKPAHPVSARFGTDLDVLGWEVREEGQTTPAASMKRGERYEFRIFYRVLRRVTTNWKTFIHIDGRGENSSKRLNGDHDTSPDYPFKEWQVGDFVVDSFVLQPDSSYPRGSYDVFFGLFNGNQRFAVSSGPQKENRIEAGVVRIE